MRNFQILFVLVVLCVGFSCPVYAEKSAGKYKIDAAMEGPESPYTSLVLKMIQTGPYATTYETKDKNPVFIQCIETEGKSRYVGAEQGMTIKAPLSTVEAILDDVAHYKDLFPDYDDVHMISTDGNKWLTFWEQHVPLFFVPNVKYEMVYIVDKSDPNKKIYRYKLKESHNIKVSDGFIVIEKAKNSSSTLYTEYDFYDADWGPLSTQRVWKESLVGLYLSDVAIKLKAENPNWPYKQVMEESKKILEKYPVEPLIEHKKKLIK